jgi:SulP family sulfate permease
MWIGANLLLDWAVLTQSQLRKRDYALLLGVLVVMMTAGPLIGIGVGFAAALILFAVDYARTDIVRARLDGTCFRSSVERSASGRAQLAELGGQIVVYRLQGFLFFATAARLREEIEERLAAGGPGSMRYLLLDFAAVTGFDSSTVMTMVRFERMALAHDFTLVFTGLKPESLEALERGGLTYGEGEPCHVIAELDRGMEYCEDRLLQAGPKPNSASLVEELSEFIGSEEKAKAFAAILEPIEFEPGDVIVARDDQADDIYFFESGRARVMPDGNDVSARRLRSFGPGSILGELAFFTGQPRQATVCATRPVKAWRLTRASLDALEKKDQNLARDFYRALSEQFAHRLSGLNRMMQYLVD